MKTYFEKPERVLIRFNEYEDGKRKKDLIIKRCAFVLTGRQIIVGFIAKDKKIHRHKYSPRRIAFIAKEGEVLYRR